MEIKILKKYAENINDLKNFSVSEDKGISMERIIELENILNQGKPFPLVFREYLYLGGDFDTIGFNGPIDGLYDKMTKGYRLRLKERRNINLDRPIIVFDSFEGESFMFIYLDEGDDPQPWNASLDKAYDTDEGKKIWKVPHPSFSDLVNTLVDRALNGLQPW